MFLFERLKSLAISGAINAFAYFSAPRATAKALIWKRGLPNPACPRLGVDKYLWRKVFDRNPAFTAMSDKLAAKQIARYLAKDLLTPATIWAGDRFEDIPAGLMAGDAVIKTNHGSGFHHIIRNGQYDPQHLARETRRWMSRDFSRYFGEWNYTGIVRKLFVEEFLKDASGGAVSAEAKVYVFGSWAPFAIYFRDRLTDHPAISLYDRTGRAHPVGSEINMKCDFAPMPEEHREVFALAENLACGMDHVRVDFYLMDGKAYFSEFTFHPLAGRFTVNMLNAFPDADSMWDLRKSWFLSRPQPGWRGAYARWLVRNLRQMAADGPVDPALAVQDRSGHRPPGRSAC